MISDEERREVAARLRGLDAEITIRNTLEQAVDKFAKAVCGDIPFSPIRYSVRNLCGLANMLADLIEPEEQTCRMIEVETGEVADYSDTDEVIFHCTSCHAERGIFSYDEDGNVYSQRPEYCPNCRAKVVE